MHTFMSERRHRDSPLLSIRGPITPHFHASVAPVVDSIRTITSTSPNLRLASHALAIAAHCHSLMLRVARGELKKSPTRYGLEVKTSAMFLLEIFTIFRINLGVRLVSQGCLRLNLKTVLWVCL